MRKSVFRVTGGDEPDSSIPMIKQSCPSCSASNEIPEAYLGHEVVCPSCRESYTAESRDEESRVEKVNPPSPAITQEMAPFVSEKKKSNLVPALIALFIALFVFVNRGSFSSPEKTKSGSIVWEYMTLREYAENRYADTDYDTLKDRGDQWVQLDADELDSHGSDGWELVTCYLEMETDFKNFGDSSLHTGIKSNVRPSALVAIFKRPKPKDSAY